MSKEVSKKESRMVGTTVLLVGTGFLMSNVPSGNLPLLAFNLSLALISYALFYYFWKTTKHHSKRYFSLLSFVMLNCMAIHFAIPLLRMYYLTLTFWIGLVVLIAMIVTPYFYSRKIAASHHHPEKSPLAKVYTVYVILVLGFGGAAYSDALYTQNPDALTLAIFAYLLSLLFLFVSPMLLIKPAEMKQIAKK